jgi:hypothetical protein
MSGRYLNGDELGLVVAVLVQAGLQLAVGGIFQID